MAKEVKAIVISGNGTNCEREMAQACHISGADQVDVVHISELLTGRKVLKDYNFLNLAGGFLDGDDLGSAMAGANRLKFARIRGSEDRLIDQLISFIKDGKLVLGVCNGFQLMVKLGLLPGLAGNYTEQVVTLTHNDSGKFEDRWVYLEINENTPCVFTKGLEKLYLPVRHGEGKFVCINDQVLERIEDNNQAVMVYSNQEFTGPSQDYPENPNGSVNAIAGICDPTGRLFGLMPHPEAYIHFTNHPHWTRGDVPGKGMGLTLFKNAVTFIKSTN